VTDSLGDGAAHISAWMDYPEEDVEEVLVCQLSQLLTAQQEQLTALVNSFDSGRLLREGISTAIVGSPNVGKSTLMNLLSGSQRSIVTDIPGTTRDVVEERVRLGELLLNLADTAGIHNTDDPVERIGVARSVAKLERCDLVLAVFDGSRPLDSTDLSLLERLEGRAAIGLCNKSDLPQRADLEKIAASTCGVVELSALDGDGVDRLEQAITQVVGIRKLQPGGAQLANQRQLSCVVAAVQALDEALQALSYGQTLDAVSVCMEEAVGALLELTGKQASAEIIDRVFENFCVGK
ncbi:MAG: GTPase, partial [Angelakisella sp.]